MPRVLGLDPGTVSIDGCVLEDGVPVAEWSLPTAQALADPAGLIARLTQGGRFDLIAGPSGYGLPLVAARDLGPDDVALALLPDRATPGGLGGLGQLMRALAATGLPVVFTPGVIHLDSVPVHRKLNRVDLGTADKVAVAALAIADQAGRQGIRLDHTSFILLDLGGAFSAALAVTGGKIVDGVGGTAGPTGWRSGGGWDGEVAFLAGEIRKGDLFLGGVESAIARGIPKVTALEGYIESAEKGVRQMVTSVPQPGEIVLTGRHADDPDIGERLAARLGRLAPVHRLKDGASSKAGALGAAIMADGLAGGRHAALIDIMGLRACGGSVLDHLVSISPDDAMKRIAP